MDQDQPFAFAVLRDITDAIFIAGHLHRRDMRHLALDPDRAAGHPVAADDRLGQFSATRANQPVEPQNLALVQGQIHGFMTDLGRHPAQVQHRRTKAAVAGLPIGNLLIPANHHLHQIGAGYPGHRFAVTGIAPVAQDGNGIANLQHFFKLMADKDNRHTLIAQPPQQGKQRIRLVAGQGCGGFVQQQDFGLMRQGFGNLDQLHLGH